MELRDAARRIREEQERIAKVLEDAGYTVRGVAVRMFEGDLFIDFHPSVMVRLDGQESGSSTAPTTQSQTAQQISSTP